MKRGRPLYSALSPQLVALAVAVTAFPSGAYAVNAVQGTATVAVGYDSNILAQPSEPAGSGTPSRIGDGEGLLSAGVIYTSALARIQQQLSYTFTGLLYFDHVAESNYANALNWRGVFETSRTTTLTLNVGLAQARIDSFLANAGASGTTTPTLTSTDDAQTLTITAGAGLVWELAARSRLTFADNFATLLGLTGNQPTTYTTTHYVDFLQLWRRDALSVRLGADETIFAAVTGTGGVVTPGYQLLLLRLVGTWTHDLSPRWSFRLGAGVVYGLRPDDGGSGTVVQPVAEASLRYFDKYLGGELVYRHDVAPNILVGQAFISDGAVLRLTAPLGLTTHVEVGVSGGYQYLQSILPDGSTGATAQVALADATLGYSPRDGITLFARYQFSKQLDVHLDGDTAVTIVPFVRHVAMVGVRFLLPAQIAVPPPPRPGQRADGADGTAAPAPHTPVAPTATTN